MPSGNLLPVCPTDVPHAQADVNAGKRHHPDKPHYSVHALTAATGLVCHGMFAQIIVDNKYIFAILHPLFADCTAGIRSKILQRRKFTCRSRNNGCITESSILFECLDNIGNGRSFLADCHINTLYPLPFLINNRVNCNRGLSGLTISDDQFLCPLPIGTMESMALIPVCSGVSTPFLEMTPDATRSTGRYLSVVIGHFPSIGCPSAFTTRPSSAFPTGTSTTRPVVLTVSPH